MTVALVCLLCLPCAPVPVARAPRPLQVPSGRYVMKWNGNDYQVRLHGDGTYTCGLPDSTTWHGYWNWSPSQRLLFIQESTNGREPWTIWLIVMDGKLQGSSGFIKVSLERIK